MLKFEDVFSFKKDPDLWRRLRFYGFGLLMGCLLVSVITRGKACRLPGTLKLEEINALTLKLNPEFKRWINCMGISNDQLKQVLKDGSVNFGKSEVHGTPYPTYAIDGKTLSGQHIRLVVIVGADTTRMISGFITDVGKSTCKCE